MLSLVPLVSLLLLLLLPPLARAQLPPPLTWSMQATACQPDDGTARRLWRVNRDYLTLLPTRLSVPARGLWPYTVHCPVTGDGLRLLNQLDVIAHDPDGLAGGARLVVEVRRHVFRPPPRSRPFYEVIGQLDTSRQGPVPGSEPAAPGHLYTTAVAGRPTDFDRVTLSVVLLLARTTLDVRPPRVYSVRLRSVPLPPIE